MFLTLPLLVVLIFAIGLGVVKADEVRLEYGDCITGTIGRMEDKLLTIRTSCNAY